MPNLPFTKEQPQKKSVESAKKKVKVVRKRQTHKATLTKRRGPKKKHWTKMTPAERQAMWEKQERALDLRLQGVTYVKIAEALGYANASSAKAAVDSVINRTEREAAKEVVAIDLARLDEYQMRCTHALRTNGDLHQIDRLMRVMEMRYRLLGISDETVRALQAEHGINVNVNIKGGVQQVIAAPESEEEFIKKMMRAVGVDPSSEVGQRFMESHQEPKSLPMLEGSANDHRTSVERAEALEEEDIVEAEIVEDMDAQEEDD